MDRRNTNRKQYFPCLVLGKMRSTHNRMYGMSTTKHVSGVEHVDDFVICFINFASSFMSALIL
jgi:hypothetical protein